MKSDCDGMDALHWAPKQKAAACLEELWGMVADAQLLAHGAHIASRRTQLVPWQVRVQVMLYLVLQSSVEPVHPHRA